MQPPSICWLPLTQGRSITSLTATVYLLVTSHSGEVHHITHSHRLSAGCLSLRGGPSHHSEPPSIYWLPLTQGRSITSLTATVYLLVASHSGEVHHITHSHRLSTGYLSLRGGPSHHSQPPSIYWLPLTMGRSITSLTATVYLLVASHSGEVHHITHSHRLSTGYLSLRGGPSHHSQPPSIYWLPLTMGRSITSLTATVYLLVASHSGEVHHITHSHRLSTGYLSLRGGPSHHSQPPSIYWLPLTMGRSITSLTATVYLLVASH